MKFYKFRIYSKLILKQRICFRLFLWEMILCNRCHELKQEIRWPLCVTEQLLLWWAAAQSHEGPSEIMAISLSPVHWGLPDLASTIEDAQLNFNYRQRNISWDILISKSIFCFQKFKFKWVFCSLWSVLNQMKQRLGNSFTNSHSPLIESYTLSYFNNLILVSFLC